MGLFKKSARNGVADDGAAPVTGGPGYTGTTSDHAAPMPKWHYGLRALQFILALLTLGLAAYAEHVYRRDNEDGYGGSTSTPYIFTMVVAVLTVLIFLPLALLHQKRPYHAGGAFSQDLLPTLLWLAALVVLATYIRFFRPSYRYQKRAWASSTAATVFAGLEFLLFLLTTLLFLRYWHRHHMSNHAGPPNYAGARGTSPVGGGPYGGVTGAGPAATGYEMHNYNRDMADTHAPGATRNNVGGDGAISEEPKTHHQDVPPRSLERDGHSRLSDGKNEF